MERQPRASASPLHTNNKMADQNSPFSSRSYPWDGANLYRNNQTQHDDQTQYHNPYAQPHQNPYAQPHQNPYPLQTPPPQQPALQIRPQDDVQPKRPYWEEPGYIERYLRNFKVAIDKYIAGGDQPKLKPVDEKIWNYAHRFPQYSVPLGRLLAAIETEDNRRREATNTQPRHPQFQSRPPGTMRQEIHAPTPSFPTPTPSFPTPTPSFPTPTPSFPTPTPSSAPSSAPPQNYPVSTLQDTKPKQIGYPPIPDKTVPRKMSAEFQKVGPKGKPLKPAEPEIHKGMNQLQIFEAFRKVGREPPKIVPTKAIARNDPPGRKYPGKLPFQTLPNYQKRLEHEAKLSAQGDKTCRHAALSNFPLNADENLFLCHWTYLTEKPCAFWKKGNCLWNHNLSPKVLEWLMVNRDFPVEHANVIVDCFNTHIPHDTRPENRLKRFTHAPTISPTGDMSEEEVNQFMSKAVHNSKQAAIHKKGIERANIRAAKPITDEKRPEGWRAAQVVGIDQSAPMPEPSTPSQNLSSSSLETSTKPRAKPPAPQTSLVPSLGEGLSRLHIGSSPPPSSTTETAHEPEAQTQAHVESDDDEDDEDVLAAIKSAQATTSG